MNFYISTIVVVEKSNVVIKALEKVIFHCKDHLHIIKIHRRCVQIRDGTNGIRRFH